MPMFRVIYEIDVEADNADDAALKVHAILDEPMDSAPVFDVIEWADNPPDFACDRPGVVTVDTYGMNANDYDDCAGHCEHCEARKGREV